VDESYHFSMDQIIHSNSHKLDMIEFVTGKIGSGKTIYAVKRIVDHIALGGTAVTNIDFIWDDVYSYLYKYKGVFAKPEQLISLDVNKNPNWDQEIPWGVPGHHVLAVWDEVQLFNNARDWKKTQMEQGRMLSFLTQSRKACVDVIFIAQAAATVEKQFRLQAQFEHYIINSSQLSLGPLGTFPKWMNFYVRHKNDMESREVLESNYGTYDKRLFPLYDTRSMLDTDMRERKLNARMVKRIKLQRRPLISRLLQI
jgi:hypothetical protein